jgi:hypothetical protein
MTEAEHGGWKGKISDGVLGKEFLLKREGGQLHFNVFRINGRPKLLFSLKIPHPIPTRLNLKLQLHESLHLTSSSTIDYRCSAANSLSTSAEIGCKY